MLVWVKFVDLWEKRTSPFKYKYYEQLNNDCTEYHYLAAGMWKEADEETFKVMLEVAGREKQRYLEREDIRQFPCEDLRIIDQLWVNYSNGHFGFSVQKEIYLSVGGILEGSRTSSPFKKVLVPFQWIYTRFGGRVRDEDDEIYEAYRRFGDRVEWRVEQKWIDPIDPDAIIYTTVNAPKGHLPRDPQRRFAWWVLFSRVETCKM